MKTIFSPAKVNLYLEITSKRDDGFHELQTIMEALSFGDKIILAETGTGNIRIDCSNPAVPVDERNLCWSAVSIYFQKAGRDNPGIFVDIEKNIPVGAGLGGGSSNAVTVLKALNEHFEFLNKEQMVEVAAEIGSDTVFFLECLPSLFCGRGEKKIQDFSWPGKHYVLYLPGFACSTPRVYGNYKLDLTKQCSEISLLPEKFIKASALDLENLIENDLKEAAFSCYPELQKVKEKIERHSRRKVFLSGSGSTLYSVFDTEKEAVDNKDNLTKELAGSVHLVYARSLVKENN